jgi:hypothetical protein
MAMITRRKSMTKFRRTICAGVFLFLALSWTVAGSPPDLQKSCRDFVQGFYDWYVPKALKVNVRPANLVLKYKSSAFSPELVRALQEDSEAQAKSPHQLVGLDFDPFLNSQDPSQRYVVGNVTVKGDRYWVEVYSITLGKRSPKPDVVPELMLKDGQWIFMNFHYGKSERSADENLVSTLKALRRHAPGQ